MSDYQNEGYELGWDAEIEKDGKDFIVAEPGDYDFTVIGFERARFGGSEKIPPCNQAKLSIRIDIPGSTEKCVVKHNLFMWSTLEWKISEFLISIGQKKKGERVAPNWNAVIGSRGRCKVTKRSFKSKNTGEDLWTNDIDKFYPPEDDLPLKTGNSQQQNTSAPVGYTVGMF